MQCEQLNDLLCLVAELEEEMESLGTIRDSKRETESYMNKHSMGDKQEELGAMVEQESCDILATTEMG